MGTTEDISTSTVIDVSTVNLQNGNPISVNLNPDKSKMWVVGVSNDIIYEFVFSVKGDVSTLQTFSDSVNIGSISPPFSFRNLAKETWKMWSEK